MGLSLAEAQRTVNERLSDKYQIEKGMEKYPVWLVFIEKIQINIPDLKSPSHQDNIIQGACT